RAAAGGAAVAREPAGVRAGRVRARAAQGARRGAAVGAGAPRHGARDGLGVPHRRSARRVRAQRRHRGPRRGSAGPREMNEQGPSVLTMIGAVALIVALVILAFFAAGYGFGRLFL